MLLFIDKEIYGRYNMTFFLNSSKITLRKQFTKGHIYKCINKA